MAPSPQVPLDPLDDRRDDRAFAHVPAVEDTRAAVLQFSEEAKLAFPIGLDLNSIVKRAYRIFGPPATFFIDAQGTVRDIVLGPVTPERAREALKKAGAA